MLILKNPGYQNFFVDYQQKTFKRWWNKHMRFLKACLLLLGFCGVVESVIFLAHYPHWSLAIAVLHGLSTVGISMVFSKIGLYGYQAWKKRSVAWQISLTTSFFKKKTR